MSAAGPGTGVARPAASSTTGLALAAVGFMLLPFGDAIGKHLAAEGFHALQIAWGRWVSHTVIITPDRKSVV